MTNNGGSPIKEMQIVINKSSQGRDSTSSGVRTNIRSIISL